ncbi:MAG: hypothetical protein HY985_08465 [Magnetospirillum sp.]|nr:hypothetical protein [Magnetospirillum sp.]
MDPIAHKITPMTVLEDIAPTVARYRAIGCEIVAAHHAGCVGLRAGKTHILLISEGFLATQDRAATALARLPPTAMVIDHLGIAPQPIEVVVKDGDELFLLAENGAG